MAIEREQPRLRPPIDGGVVNDARHLGPGGATSRRLPLGAHHDQPLEELPHTGALGVVERAIQRLGPGGNRPIDPAQLPVGGERQITRPRFVRPARTG